SSRRRHTRLQGDWSSDVCSSDLPRWLDYEKADTVLGAIVVVVGAAAIMMAAASAFGGTRDFGHFSSGLEVAQGLARNLHPGVGEIGRASCRERGEIGAGGGGVEI